MTETTSAPHAPARTHHCPACDRGGYACELPRDHVGPHRVTFGADDEGPIPDRVWDDRQPTIAPADDQRVAVKNQINADALRLGELGLPGTEEAAFIVGRIIANASLLGDAVDRERLDALAARTAELERENAELHGEVAAYRETRTAEVIADLQAQLEQAAREKTS